MDSSGNNKLGAFIAIAVCLNWWSAAAKDVPGQVPVVGIVHGDVSTILPCLEALTPCQEEEKAEEVTPRCCVPLLDLVANDAECLCSIFFNNGLMAQFNVTREQALVMSRKCGARIPLNYCANYVHSSKSIHLSPTVTNALSPSVPVEELQGSNGDSRGGITLANVVAIIVINKMMI